ncbi:FadR/GntR family transcriptional regulator [Streptomyces sp. NPDC050538]|uniref:FadR/GntR family transcriptional regulator n=1 Tax=Streptomyces sp. NPDC050538 TaxID=3365627 RepID=UPI00378C76BC
MALAAERRTDTDLEAMAAPLARAQDPALDITEWLSTDLEFHTAITRAAGNRILELAMTSVHLVRPMTNTVFVDLLDRDTIQAQHTAIFEAIRDQDADRAEARLLDHVNHLDEVRTQALADRRARARSRSPACSPPGPGVDSE